MTFSDIKFTIKSIFYNHLLFYKTRPIVNPINKNTKPIIFCANILLKTISHCESFSNSPVSKTYVENVVKAPIKPASNTVFAVLLIPIRCSAIDQINPKKKQPAILTTIVPHGKPLLQKRCIKPERVYLANVPIPPKTATHIIFCHTTHPVF